MTIEEATKKFEKHHYVCVDENDYEYLNTELIYKYGTNKIFKFVMDGKFYICDIIYFLKIFGKGVFVTTPTNTPIVNFMYKYIRKQELVKNRTKVIDNIL